MKHSIKLGLHIKPNNNGVMPPEAAIRLRVSWAGLRVDLRSGYLVPPDKWDPTSETVRHNTKNDAGQTAGEINRALSRLCGVVEACLEEYERNENRPPSVKELKAAFDVATGRMAAPKPVKVPLLAVFDQFVEQQAQEHAWSKATRTKFGALRLHLEEWRADQPLEEFTKDDFAAFVAYLQTSVRQLNSTVEKNIGFLRWFLRWAAANGYYNGLAHLNYRPRLLGLDSKEVIYLEWEELQTLLAFNFGPGRGGMAAARDVFCFCCFTGLRYSDVAKLMRSDLYLDAPVPYLVTVTKKTGDRLRIELNRYALAILAKYQSLPIPDGRALPVISNVKYNEHIHEFCRLAGIDTPVRLVRFKGSERTEMVVPKYAVVTSHAARRTFVVTALRLGIPPAVIMKWTGHSDYKSMRPYIAIADAAKVENMAKFDNLEADK